jgi:hypothetical protein
MYCEILHERLHGTPYYSALAIIHKITLGVDVACSVFLYIAPVCRARIRDNKNTGVAEYIVQFV